MCEGEGCEACVDGFFEVTECPGRWAGPWVQVVRLARLARAGSWPVDGGTLEQTAWFMSAFDQLEGDDRREECRCRR